jgi:acetolactate synthase-1/2/3 large subunit
MRAPPPATSQPLERVVEVFLNYLRAEGARVVFGVPGGLLHPFFEAIDEADDLTLICTKHEQGAAFMADGYARTSGQLSVCASTAGPGATNLLTGVAVAHSDGIPMLVITGQPPTQNLGRGAAQEATRVDTDIVEMFRPVTKYSTMVDSPQSLAMHLRRALRRALTGRRGPVHLNIPVDIWNQPLDEEWFDPKTYRSETTTFDRKAVQRAAEALMDAKYPVILAGSGTRSSGAHQHLRALAELLPARVATSPRGKGLFPEDHPLSLGVMGHAGHQQAATTIFGDETDVLLTVGCALDETTTFSWDPRLLPKQALLQCDIDPDQLGRNYPVDVPLVGDAQSILTEIVYHLHRAIRDGRAPASLWDKDLPLLRGAERSGQMEMRLSDSEPVTPQRWRAELQDVLPHDAIVFSDVGGHMLFNIKHLHFRDTQRFALNLGFASMGHGTCAPIGAALAFPDRPVFSIAGDGCFTMNGMELLTAVEYEIPVIWMIENNNMHGITWHGSQLIGSGRPMDCVKLKRAVHVAAIARAMGLQTWVVRSADEVIPAVEGALRCGGPALIEVLVDPSVPPPLIDRARSISGSAND